MNLKALVDVITAVWDGLQNDDPIEVRLPDGSKGSVANLEVVKGKVVLTVEAP